MISAVPDSGERQQELLRYVERFALVLRGLGMPPMAARVLAYAIAEDGSRYTAAELAEALQVSPAAVSGAVNYLVGAGLLAREREPGTRSDLYVLHDEDPWAAIVERRMGFVEEFVRLFEDGAEVVGPQTPGGRRLAGSAEFFAFFGQEIEALLARWRERTGPRERAASDGADPAGRGRPSARSA